jgi:hypothetical protein
MEIKSTFDPENAAGNVTGAAYLTVESQQLPAIAGRRITIEMDASADGSLVGQSTEIQLVQNGLAQSGWKRFPIKAGRQKYRFDYTSPPDGRPPSKVDTFWVRSDSDGRGRPIVLHAVHLYID